MADQITPLARRTSSSLAVEPAPETDARIESVRGRGNPLPDSTRAYFEPRFGQNFSKVRVHTGLSEAETAQEVNAKAFTIGHDIFFGAGQYTPGAYDGQKLLAHELVHVIQQLGMSGTNDGATVIQPKTKLRPQKVSCAKYSTTHPVIKTIGTDDPVGQIEIAIDRAVELLDTSIERLQLEQNDSPDNKSAPPSESSPERRSDAHTKALIERFTSAKTILEGGEIFFVCLGHDCRSITGPPKIEEEKETEENERPRNEVDPIIIKVPVDIDIIKTKAYVTSPRYTIFLCNLWWNDMNSTERAITLIHEALHIYYWGLILDSGPPLRNVYYHTGKIRELNELGSPE